MAGRRKRHPGKHGFRSKAQWRLFFANPRLRKYARKWAHRTPGGPIVRYRRLPARVGVSRRGGARRRRR